MASRSTITLQTTSSASANTHTSAITTESTAGWYTRVTNGGTPPTTGCLVTVYEKHGSDRVKIFSVRAGIVASTAYEWPISIDPACGGIEVDYGATSQSVTKELEGTSLTL